MAVSHGKNLLVTKHCPGMRISAVSAVMYNYTVNDETPKETRVLLGFWRLGEIDDLIKVKKCSE